MTILTFALSMHCSGAPDVNAAWQKGNDFYGSKQYDSAAAYYEQIAALKPESADIYYNLGNAYYRQNKIAFAILNYERALKLNPEHKEAKENLLMAESRINNHIVNAGDIFFINWWQSITRATNATKWAVAALVAFSLIIVLIFIRRFQKISYVPAQLQGVLIFFFACLIALAVSSADHAMNNSAAVVMQTDAPLMNAEQKGKPLTLVPEGTVIKVLSDKGDWLEVRLPDGRSGWLQQTLLSRI